MFSPDVLWLLGSAFGFAAVLTAVHIWQERSGTEIGRSRHPAE